MQVAYIGGLMGDQLREDLKPYRGDLENRGLVGRKLHRQLGKIHFKRKISESAFDRQWNEESAALYAMTHVQMATEDVAGPNENTFETALDRLARIDFVYQQRSDLIHVSGLADMECGQREGHPCTVYHLAGEAALPRPTIPNLLSHHAQGYALSPEVKGEHDGAILQSENAGMTSNWENTIGNAGSLVVFGHARQRAGAFCALYCIRWLARYRASRCTITRGCRFGARLGWDYVPTASELADMPPPV